MSPPDDEVTVDVELPPHVAKTVQEEAHAAHMSPSEYMRQLALSKVHLPKLWELADARNALAFSTEQRDAARGELRELLGPDFQVDVQKAERKLPHLITPSPTTASNAETLMMSWAYLYAPLMDRLDVRIVGESTPRENTLVMAATASSDKLWAFRTKFTPFEKEAWASPAWSRFAKAWFESSFARLEVGHKLAASLCLTDIPASLEIRAPWAAWSLLIPDGLFPDLATTTARRLSLARVWIVGTEARFLLGRDGNVVPTAADGEWAQLPTGRALSNLIRGACLALSNPDDFKKERQHRPSSRSTKHRRAGAPDFEQAKFLLSAPVTVDFREHLHDSLSGERRGSSPKAQFLVRGHWRNQAHGPRRSLRRAQWIEPFWKGDAEARVLLRQHRAEVDPTEPSGHGVEPKQ